jgi:hypothetical protein
VGAAGVRGRDGHGAGGCRHGPLKQVPPVAKFCSVVGVSALVPPPQGRLYVK